MFNSAIDIKFSDCEVRNINSLIKKNDYNSFIDFINSKKNINFEVEKGMFLDTIDDLWEFIIDNASVFFSNDETRQDFLSQLSKLEKLAVQFGDFNYQVENGGLCQWDDNGFSEDLDDLKDFLNESTFNKKEDFLSILDAFSNVKASIDSLSQYDDWYEQDVDTRWNSLEYYDEQYYDIMDEWNDYFQEYLRKKVSIDYFLKIDNTLSSISV